MAKSLGYPGRFWRSVGLDPLRAFATAGLHKGSILATAHPLRGLVLDEAIRWPIASTTELADDHRTRELRRHDELRESGEEFGEWERAVAAWWDEVVLPVGCMQDGVDSGVG